jgi:hypothetical protein
MRAAFYEKQGPAREVLQVGEQPRPEPGPGEVRVHLKTSGANPSDWKSRSGRTATMLAPLIIPHSDGAGERYLYPLTSAMPKEPASGFRRLLRFRPYDLLNSPPPRP